MSHETVTIGVLAIQGAFQEHIARFASLNASSSGTTVRALAIRRPEQLAQCHGLVLPGGESTSIVLGLRNADLLEPLRVWIREGKPVWGTCAGMIMLASVATGGKRGGQELLGGMDVQVGRNGFGSQVYSFECDLPCPALGEAPFPGVFIRAPVVEKLLTSRAEEQEAVTSHEQKGLTVAYCPPDMRCLQEGVAVEPLVWLPLDGPSHAEATDASRIVAYRQGALLATSFHPELTSDTRLHSYFVRAFVLPAMHS
ncbi:Senecionine N-oxygenase [Malassezia pachydermatis]|uniref:glutaminase n=1 Tax=Malassezia pachydermatis TaxID=77020 RepID=A0A0M9VRC6_9BASI|nr:pyridoxine [Malassezia pachydermatis]KOS16473.1 pyridoxine [Malassezia pachydermatis]